MARNRKVVIETVQDYVGTEVSTSYIGILFVPKERFFKEFGEMTPEELKEFLETDNWQIARFLNHYNGGASFDVPEGTAYKTWRRTVYALRQDRPENLGSKERRELNKTLRLEEFFDRMEYKRQFFC